MALSRINATPEAGMDGEPAKRTLVLIAEDEPDNREIMRAVVEDLLGYDTLLVSDGAAALEAAEREQPSLILMDLMMPGLDGFEATRRLKSGAGTSHIPVIAVTALSRPADHHRAVQEGAADYVSKPFDLDTLVSVIVRHVSGRVPEEAS